MSQRRFLFSKKKRAKSFNLPGNFLDSLRRFLADKRQRFVLSVLVLTAGLFFSENLLSKSGFFIVIALAALTDLLLFVSVRKDMKENSVKVSGFAFILPFFYTLSFGLFYFLVPARFLTRLLVTLLYASGLYSLFLAENIFLIAASRTIALLSGARIISFILTIVSFFFLSDVFFSFDLPIIPTAILIFVSSFFLILHSIWSTLIDQSFLTRINWTIILSVCLLELSLVLGFWPVSSTVIAIFLTGFFYIIVGISQVWLDR
ncbi:MAG: hypothetical protein M1289_02185, partial [Patescibacteria group bacterium]|nr:hypothetical protein [Patescibacteria group bacterium]